MIRFQTNVGSLLDEELELQKGIRSRVLFSISGRERQGSEKTGKGVTDNIKYFRDFLGKTLATIKITNL